MRVIVYDETRDAMQDARWCYVPTDHAANIQQQMHGWIGQGDCWSAVLAAVVA